MNKYVIFTSLVGSYDEIHQPLIVDERFDYILFSDNVTKSRIGIWKVYPISRIEGNDMLRSRYVKCHPTKVLSEYEASLYVDANIQIATQYVYDRFFELLEEGTDWAGIQHPSQNCVYEEMCAIVDLKWVHDYDVVDWYGTMKKAGFPENWGLYENNVIFRRHTARVDIIGNLWWQTLVSGCKRDQFSLMYALWKVQPSLDFFLPKGEVPRLNSQNFRYYEHNPHKRVLRLGVHERIRRSSLRSTHTDIRKGYHELFNRLSKYKSPKTMLHVWEVVSFFKDGPRVLINALKSRLK